MSVIGRRLDQRAGRRKNTQAVFRGDLFSEDSDVSGCWFYKTKQHLQGGGFPCPVGSEKAVYASSGNAQVKAVYHNF